MSLTSTVLGTDDVGFLRSYSVQLVLLVSVVSSMSSIASPALPAMGEALAVSPSRIGLVFTAYTLPGVFLLPAVGAIADVYGQRIVVTLGLLVFGAAGLAVGLTTDFEVILALRALQGSGYAAFNPLTVSLLGTFLSGEEEAASQGVRVVFNKLASFLGPAIGGVLAAIAWFYPFFLYGLAIPVGVLVYVSFREEASADGENEDRDDRDASQTSEDGHDEQSADDDHDPQSAGDDSDRAPGDERRTVREYGRDLVYTFRRPAISAIVLGGFFRMVLKYTFYTFIALAVVQQFDGGAGVAGLLVGSYSLVGAVVSTQSARFVSRLGHTYSLLGSFALASLAFVLLPLAGGIVAVSALVLVHGIGEGVLNPIHKSVLTQSVGPDVRVGLVTTNGVAQSIGRTITPVALSPLLVLGWNYTGLFFVAGAVTLVLTVGLFLAVLIGDFESPVAG